MKHPVIEDKPSAMAHRKVVSLDADKELHYWVSAFESSPSELRRAVREVGSSVAAVRQHLAANGNSDAGGARR